jgi:quercetin dioxygenase-like cupin family protein
MRISVASAAFVVALSCATAAQQAAPTFDPTAIPVDREPQHRLVFSNEYVRVVDARLPPGYVSLKHTHAADNVTVTIAPGGNDPQSLARIGRAGFAKGGYSHAVTNAGDSEQRFINVEILTSGAAATDDRPLAAHTLELENAKVRVYRVVLSAGQSMAGHSHGHGWLAVTVKGGAGAGAYRWHAAGSAEALTNSGTAPLEIVEIEPK